MPGSLVITKNSEPISVANRTTFSMHLPILPILDTKKLKKFMDDIDQQVTKNPENAMKLLDAVWPSAIARVKEEVADMQAVADAEGANITIEPWDYRYYAEKVRKVKYDLDSDEVKQYLQLDKLTDAMHYVAGRLFNYKFTPVPEGTVLDQIN